MQYPDTRAEQARPRALIYAAHPEMELPLRQLLQQADWHVESCRTQNELTAMMESRLWLLVVIVHERNADGLADTLLLFQPQLANELTFAIVVAEQMTISDAILCTRHGALDYLGWPVMPSQYS